MENDALADVPLNRARQNRRVFHLPGWMTAEAMKAMGIENWSPGGIVEENIWGFPEVSWKGVAQ